MRHPNLGLQLRLQQIGGIIPPQVEGTVGHKKKNGSKRLFRFNNETKEIEEVRNQ